MKAPLAIALESRFMFDAAGAATAAGDPAADHHADPAAANPDGHTADVAQKDVATPAPAAAMAAPPSGPVEVRAVDPVRNDGRKEVVFILSDVADYQSFVDGAKSGVEIVLLDASKDGLTQMAQWAQSHQGYDAIHVVSHGSEGTVNLGSLVLDSQTLATRSADVAALGSALNPDGDLLLYGCEVAGHAGQSFVTALAGISGADVAASNDLTGSSALGGNWILETKVGSIETAVAFSDASLARYDSLLVTDSVTFNSGVTGSLTSTVTVTTTDFGNVVFKLTDSGLTTAFGSLAAPSSAAVLDNADPGSSSKGLVINIDPTTSPVPNQPDYFVFATSNGSNFRFDSIDIFDFNSQGYSVIIVGYRDGVQQQSQTVTDTDLGNSPTVTLSADFNNVDEIRLYTSGGSSPDNPLELGFDNVILKSPVASGPPPTVTDANISISGATGTGGTYKIGDTVTATWDNTAAGDNNSGISGVTVDFSQFGGGTAVTATESSGVWTATYVITSGSVDGTNKNVSVKATKSDGGNATTADTSNATVDGVMPSVQSVSVTGSPAATATSVTFRVTFSESVSGVTTDDFQLTATGSASGTIASISGSGTTRDITVNGISGDGTLRLDLKSGTDIVDAAGNGNNSGGHIAAYSSGSAHTADLAGPSFSSSATQSVAENTTAVVTLAASDTNAPITYSIVGGADSGKFTLSSGALSFTSAPNYESPTDSDSDNVYVVTVRATDALGNTTDRTFNVTVTNVNETPTDITLSNATLTTSAATSAATVGSLTTADPDTGQSHTYTLVSGTGSTDNASFSISGSNLVVGSSPLSAGTYSVRVRATDNGSGTLFYEKAFTITVSANAAPVISDLNGDTKSWGGVGGTVFLDTFSVNTGVASVTDAENDQADWGGGSLTVQRATGGAWSADVFAFSTIYFVDTPTNATSGTLRYYTQANGTSFASYTNANGVLTITLNSSATTAMVSSLFSGITYRNDTPAGDATIRFTLDDGHSASTTADVTVTTDFIYVTGTGDGSIVDVTDGVGLREAVAIASGQTGTQTIVFDSGLAGGTITLGSNLAIGENITFDADAASGLTITNSTITVASGTTLTLTNGSSDTLSIASKITGSGAITKTGTGTATLSGGNDYSGATSVSDGTLTVNGGIGDSSAVTVASGATLNLSGAETIGSLTGTGAITLGGNTLTAGGDNTSTSFDGIISGTGGLAKAGTGTLTLTGTNSYTGTTTVSAGTLELNSSAGTAIADGSAVTLSGGTLKLSSATETIGTLSGASGTLALGGNALTVTQASNGTFSGAITGTSSGSLTLNAAANSTSLTLDGTTNSTGFAGGITVTKGWLQVSADSNLGTGTLTLNGGTLRLSATAATISNAVAIGSSGGTISVAPSGGNLTLSGVLSGSGNLIKAAGGDLTLSGNNSGFSGAFTINSGTVTVSHANALGDATGGTTVADGAALVLSGGITIAENLTLSGSGVSSGGALVSASGTNTVSGTVTLNADATVTATSALTVSGVVSGGNALTKAGTGTLTLSGDNSYSGATTVSAGTLVAGHANALGTTAAGTTVGSGAAVEIANGITLAENFSIAGTGVGSTGALTVASGSTVTLSGTVTLTADASIGGAGTLTVSGVVSGSNALTKVGSGTLTLSGNNSYSGATTVSGGTLVAGHANALGTTAAGTTVSSGAAVEIANGITLAENFSIAGTGVGSTGALTVASGSTATVSGTVTLTANAGIGGVGTLTVSGAIGGSFNLTKPGAGTLTLSGNNSYTGTTTISAGTLIAAHDNALGTTAGGTTVSSGATLALADGITLAEALTIGGVGVSSAGALQVTSGSATVSGAITLSGNTTIGVSGTGLTLSNAIGGAFNLVKDGTGTLTLSGTNTYTGTTTVGAGTLTVTGTLNGSSAGAVTVGTGGTLAGTGTVNGGLTVQSGGTLSPGIAGTNSGVGTLTVNGGLTIQSGGTLAVDLVSTSSYDQVAVTGAVDVSSATLTTGGSYTPVKTTSGDSFAIVTNDGSDAVTGSFNGLASGASITLNSGSITISYAAGSNGNDVVLTGPVNQAPALGGFTTAGTVNDNATTTPFGSVTVTDADDTTGTFTVTITYTAANGTLSSAGGGLTGSAGSYTLTATTPSGLQALLRALVFTPTNNQVVPGSTVATSFTLTASDGTTSSSANSSTSFTTTSINDAPTDIALSNSSVSVYDGSSATVGTLSATDADTGQTLTYSLVGGSGSTDNSLFTISGTSLVANDASTLTAGQSYSVRVQVSDGTTTYEKSFTISVNNDLVVDVLAVDSSAPAGTYSADKADGGGLDLREAITIANAFLNTNPSSTVTIRFDGTLTGTITLPTSLAVRSGVALAMDSTSDNLSLIIQGVSSSLTMAGTLNVSVATGDTLTINNVLAGSGAGLTKTGAGTLALGGNNSYTGATTVSGGGLTINGSIDVNSAVSVGSGTTLTVGASTLEIGSLAGAGTVAVASGKELTVGSSNASTSFSGNFSGAGDLIKMGSGTMTLSGTSSGSFSGTTAVREGTLSVAGDANLGSGTVTLNGGTLTVTGADTIDNAIALGSNGGTVSNGSALTLSGAISGTSTLTKAGGGTLTLSTATSNGSAWNLSVDDGTVSVDSASRLGTGSITLSDGTLSVTGTTTLVNAVAITNANAKIDVTGSATATFSGVLSGSLGLAKTGTGTLALSNAANTYSGALSILGTLELQSALSASSFTLGNSSAVLAFNNSSAMTVSASISGQGTVTKSGTGTATLSGANTWSGGTTLSAGKLSVAGSGNIGGGAITMAGGTLALSGTTTLANAIDFSGNSTIEVSNSGTTATLSGARSGSGGLTKTGGGALTLGSTSSSQHTHTGGITVSAGTLTAAGGWAIGDDSTVTMSGSSVFVLSASETIAGLSGISTNAVTLGAYTLTVGGSGSTTFSGAINGTGGLTKTGAGTLTLAGTSTYSGATTVNGGGLTISGALGSSTAVTVASTATMTVDAASLEIGSLDGAGTVAIASGKGLFVGGSNASTSFSGIFSGAGGLTKMGSGTMTLSGANSTNFSGTMAVREGTLSIAGDANLGSGDVTLNGGTLTVTGVGTIDNGFINGVNGATIDNAVAVTLSGAITGSGSLTKTGSGTLTLSNGANSYSDSTTVSAGTLLVTGALTGTSGVSVQSGATLGGTGTIFASGSNQVTIASGATLAPGVSGSNNGIGTLTINGNLRLSGTLAAEIGGGGGVGGTDYDQVVVNGTVSLNGGPLTVSRVNGYTLTNGATYRIIDNDGSDAIAGTSGIFGTIAEGTDTTSNGDIYTVSYLGGTGNDAVLTAVVNPTVSSVSATTADGSYKAGDTISITVTFNRAVTVTGTPTLSLGTGRTASYSSGSGGTILTFTYTVQAGDTSADLDYASTGALALNGGTIADSSSSLAALLTLATPGAANSLGANKAIVIDTTAPSAPTAPDMTAGTDSGGSSTDNVTSNTTPTFTGTAEPNSTVTLYDTDGTTVLGTGTTDGSGNYSVTATTALTSGAHTLTVKATDAAGNVSSVSGGLSVTIDTSAPAAPGTPVLPAASDTGISGSDGITGTATPTITGTAEPNSTVTLYDTDGTTVLGTGTADGSGNYSVTATTLSTGPHTLTVKATDAAGNVSTASPGLSVTVDTTAPTVTGVTSSTADGSYKAGDIISIQVSLSEAVIVSGTPTITLSNGRTATYSGGSGGTTLTFTYTVQDGDTSTDLDYASTGALALNGGTITDTAGNDATTTLPAVGGGSSLGGTKNIVIDTTAPTVSSVSVPTGGIYKTGDVMEFTVAFSEAVTVTGSPTLPITLDDGTVVQAAYVSGSGGSSLTFRYTVQGGLSDSDGVRLVSALSGGTITDLVGNTAIRTLNSVADTAGARIDSIAPTVTNVTSSTANGTYTTGETISIQVTFSEAVSVSGTPTLALNTGRTATYSSGSGTGTLTFTYTVQAGDTSADLDAIGTSALTGSITDIAGNAGTLTLAMPGDVRSLGLSKDIVIDTTAPSIRGVVAPADGLYGVGKTLSFYIQVSEVVIVNGTPTITLDIGGQTRQAVYNPTASSGTVLRFDYVVQAGDSDTDGIAVTGLNYNGGSITDRARIPLSPALTGVPGLQNVLVDTVAPDTPSVPVLASGQDTGTSPTDGVTNISRPTLSGTAEAGSTVTVLVDGLAVGTTIAGSDGSWSFTPANPLADGTHAVTSRATDQAGNSSGTSAALTLTIDSTAPVLSTPALSGVDNTANVVSTTRPTLTGTADPNSTVTVIVDGIAVGTATTGSDGSWSFAVTTPLADGAHSVVTTATDSAGNIGRSGTLSLTVDTQAPTVSAGGTAPTLSAGGTATLGSAVSLSDASSLNRVTVTLTDARSGDELVIGTLPAGITATRDGTSIVLSGVASAADYQAAVRAIGLRSSAGDPSFAGAATSRSISIQARDLVGNSSTATTVTVAVARGTTTVTTTTPTPTTGVNTTNTPATTTPVTGSGNGPSQSGSSGIASSSNGPSSNGALIGSGTGGSGPSLPGGGTNSGGASLGGSSSTDAGRSVTLNNIGGGSSSTDAGRSVTLSNIGGGSSSTDAGRSVTLNSIGGGSSGSSGSGSGLGGSGLGGGLGSALGSGLGGNLGGGGLGGNTLGTGTGGTGLGGNGLGGPQGTGPNGQGAPGQTGTPGNGQANGQGQNQGQGQERGNGTGQGRGPTAGQPGSGQPAPQGQSQQGQQGQGQQGQGEPQNQQTLQNQGQNPGQNQGAPQDGGGTPADGSGQPAEQGADKRAETMPASPGFARQVARAHGGPAGAADLLAALASHVLPDSWAA
nr:Ig-like domain-containing protein [Azospirillum sp. 412522]